jgi:hypothetical protein
MPQPALKILETTPPAIRRFSTADLSKHGGWVMQRLLKKYPTRDERFMANFLNGLIYSNECLFLYQDHAVALAQVVNTYSLESKPLVQERFVWCEDPDNALYVADAAHFYDEFARWAKDQRLDKIIVQESSDVPHEKIKDRLGRLYQAQLTFARL